jgi:hypothetical protein
MLPGRRAHSHQRRCLHCFAGFRQPDANKHGGHPKLICSEICRKALGRARLARRRRCRQKTCGVCRRSFSPVVGSKSPFCSAECRRQRRAQMNSAWWSTRGRERGAQYRASKNPKHDLICVGCKTTFKTANRHRKFCSHHCYGLSLRRAAPSCRQCHRPLCGPRKHRNYFCSKECFGLSRRKKVTPRCSCCGAKFVATPFKAQHRKFCSHRCFSEYSKSADTIMVRQQKKSRRKRHWVERNRDHVRAYKRLTATIDYQISSILRGVSQVEAATQIDP